MKPVKPSPKPEIRPGRPAPDAARLTLLEWVGGLAIVLAAYGRLLAGVPHGTDNILMYSPFYAQRWILSDGLLGFPLFAHYHFSGLPLHDNLQAALLYPLRWPFFFLEDWTVYSGLYHWLHYVVAMSGMVLLLRGWGIRGAALLFGVVVTVASSGYGGRIINPTIFCAACWLPWLLHGAAGWKRGNDWAALVATAMICAIGSPHLMLYGAVGFVIVFFGWTWPRPASRPKHGASHGRSFNPWAAAARKFGYVCVGAALVSPTLIPGVLRAGNSVRSQSTAENNLADSLAWSEVALSLLGGTGGRLFPEHIDRSVFVGGPVLLLCAWACLRRRERSDRRIQTALALIGSGLFFALGKNVGLQHVQPYVPGFKVLEGPLRALCLTGVGFGLMAAVAFARPSLWQNGRLALVSALAGAAAFGQFCALAWRLPTEHGAGPWLDEWLRVWLMAPGAVEGKGYALLNTGVGLLVFAALVISCGLARTSRYTLHAQFVLLAFLLASFAHFSPRVVQPQAARTLFDAPQSVRVIRQQADNTPFRIAGYDPLRYTDGQINARHAFEVLAPNLAGLHGLEDIQGFDPLIPVNYIQLFERHGGRPPYNDRIRNLDLNRPDPALLGLLNVRYIIGNPFDRPVTNLPVSVVKGSPRVTPPVWKEEPFEGPVGQWRFVSFIDGELPPIGAEVARIQISADEGHFEFPLRHGLETGHIMARDRPGLVRNYGVPQFLNWEGPSTDPRTSYRARFANYLGFVDFGRPLRVRTVSWEVVRPNVLLRVSSQACRLAPSPEQAARWRLVEGNPDGPTPVFEFLDAAPRAKLLSGALESDGADGVRVEEAVLAGKGSPGDVDWTRRGPRQFQLRVRAEQPALLFLSQLADAGWRIESGGGPVSPLTVNGLFLGVRVPQGESVLNFTYAPRLWSWLMVLSLALLAGCVWVAVGQAREHAATAARLRRR